MMEGRFNTDSKALQKRLLAHDLYAQKDLNEWIFSHLQPESGDSILDLGCGTGKQSLPLAKIVGKNGHIVAVDISQDSLSVLRDVARQAHLEETISTHQRDLTEFGQYFFAECFDRVVASFSLYYASDANRVVREVHRVLKPSGVFFFCGPTCRNNQELKFFLSSLPGKISRDVTVVPTFMEETGPSLSRAFFGKVERFDFENPLLFDSPEALYAYWSAHNLYDGSLDLEFRAAAKDYFQENGVFRNVKRVLGIKAIK